MTMNVTINIITVTRRIERYLLICVGGLQAVVKTEVERHMAACGRKAYVQVFQEDFQGIALYGKSSCKRRRVYGVLLPVWGAACFASKTSALTHCSAAVLLHAM